MITKQPGVRSRPDSAGAKGVRDEAPQPERRILFVKRSLSWPRSSGHDVHTFYMMKALVDLGLSVGLTTLEPVSEEALGGLRLAFSGSLPGDSAPSPPLVPPLSWAQNRFRSYWGVERDWISRLAAQAREFRADVVVVVGLEMLPCLAASPDAVRIWYAADEWAWHHLSQVRIAQSATWNNVREALVKGACERAYSSLVDRVWVVSNAEKRAMRWFAGMGTADVVPNGVDADYYRPLGGETEERSAVFWGRLDFGPNIQALRWFCREIWPGIRRRVPGAGLTVIGFQPTPEMQQLAEIPGVRLLADLPDLREEVSRHALVVLPFVSGGGIKNKLLEAAALGRPILCTPRACSGLRGDLPGSVVSLEGPEQWIERMVALWSDPEERSLLGERARAAVIESHSWTAAARTALTGIEASLARRSDGEM